jgi:hypothetical protein
MDREVIVGYADAETVRAVEDERFGESVRLKVGQSEVCAFHGAEHFRSVESRAGQLLLQVECLRSLDFVICFA